MALRPPKTQQKFNLNKGERNYQSHHEFKKLKQQQLREAERREARGEAKDK